MNDSSDRISRMEKNADGSALRPKVGVGVMILNDNNEVLLMLRHGSHGAGEWAFPGGHLEFGDTIFETAQREVKEETGLDVTEFELVSVFDKSVISKATANTT